MGMFDNLNVRMQLPAPEYQNNSFQTKDFENLLETYLLDSDGILYREVVVAEEIPDSSTFLGYRMKEISRTKEKYEHTGNVRFYDSTGQNSWIEFNALIFEGVCQRITIVEEKVGNLFRIEREKPNDNSKNNT
jgi:hypothetical protein